jgi:hypothetical protein
MTSKEEIRTAFIAELKNTPEYAIILNIKQKILDEIAAPNIQKTIHYDFDRYISLEEQSNIRLCSIVEFGFEIYVSEFFAEVYMDKFIE